MGGRGYQFILLRHNTRAMKTAVEFLVEQICTSDMYNLIFREEIKQAKAMEKEQIVNAYDRGYKACDLDEALEINKTMFSGERYYNQTYNQNK